jgi:fluoroacetyl-CoA thioesterase
MRSPLTVGDRTSIEITVTAEQTAKARLPSLEPRLAEVLATAEMVMFIERAASELLARCLEAHETSVGVKVDITHEAPAVVGQQLRVNAIVEEVSDKVVVFDVEAWCGDTSIAHGSHTRTVVNVADFERTARAAS